MMAVPKTDASPHSSTIHVTASHREGICFEGNCVAEVPLRHSSLQWVVVMGLVVPKSALRGCLPTRLFPLQAWIACVFEEETTHPNP